MRKITKTAWSMIVVDIILFAHAGFLSYVGYAEQFITNRRSATAGMAFTAMIIAAWVLAIFIVISGLYGVFTRRTEPFLGAIYAVILWIPVFIATMILVTIADARGGELLFLMPFLPYFVPVALLAGLIMHLTRRCS